MSRLEPRGQSCLPGRPFETGKPSSGTRPLGYLFSHQPVRPLVVCLSYIAECSNIQKGQHSLQNPLSHKRIDQI